MFWSAWSPLQHNKDNFGEQLLLIEKKILHFLAFHSQAVENPSYVSSADFYEKHIKYLSNSLGSLSLESRNPTLNTYSVNHSCKYEHSTIVDIGMYVFI